MPRSPVSSPLSAPERLAAPYLAALLRAVESSEVPVEELLSGTGLSIPALEQPEASLPLGDAVLILQRLRDVGFTAELGMRVSRNLDLRHQGFLGYAVLASSSLRDALELAMRYLRTRTRLLAMEFSTRGEHGIIRFDEGVPLGDLYPVVMDTLVVALFHVGRQLFGERPPPEIQVQLGYPEQPHHALLREFTQADLLFDCTWCQICFPVSWLALPIGTADPNMARLAAEQCEQALRDMDQSEGLLGRVRQLAAGHLQQARTVEAVAGALHMTPRTLRRRLRELGTNYQTLVEELRERRACDLLAHTRRSVDDIALELGYADPSNFGRAFRRWTGMSPTAWRHSRR
jgi:AraC-like DNA-binding protein